MRPDLLHVVAVVSNPRRYKKRYAHFEKFITHMVQSGVQLHVVECAFGERPHYLADKIPEGVDYIPVRTKHELWMKENLINEGVSKLPEDWKYVAWIDGDVQFFRPDWAEETVHMLQHHPIVQLFSHIVDTGPNYEVVYDSNNESKIHMGFAHQYIQDAMMPEDQAYNSKYFWHPGYAWACTREAWNIMGGLIDKSICGAGDHQMAWSLIGQSVKSLHPKMPKEYNDYVRTWEKNSRAIHNQIGYVPGVILHHWHGKRTNRRYRERWNILIDAKYNPMTDVKYDSQGVLQLQETNSKLMRDLQFYFQQRNEDGIDVE